MHTCTCSIECIVFIFHKLSAEWKCPTREFRVMRYTETRLLTLRPPGFCAPVPCCSEPACPPRFHSSLVHQVLIGGVHLTRRQEHRLRTLRGAHPQGRPLGHLRRPQGNVKWDGVSTRQGALAGSCRTQSLPSRVKGRATAVLRC